MQQDTSKEGLRKKIVSLRLQLSQEELIEKSQKIQARLFSIPEFFTGRSILFYISVKNEVLTDMMIRGAIEAKKKIFLPVVVKDERNLEIYESPSLKGLTKGPYAIMEPNRLTARKGEIGEIDLIVLPGIAFDVKGNRVGYGKGYYDTFFKDASSTVPKIALAFDFQIVPQVTVSAHDVRVDKIITESKIIDCI